MKRTDITHTDTEDCKSSMENKTNFEDHKEVKTKQVILIAHRGKGPTSKFTAPTEKLWYDCKNKNLLINNTVPQKILESFNIRLPENIPPENTISAFRKGLEEGADAIELDIFLSENNVPMVIHDNELNRNVSGARRIATEPEKDGHLGYVGNYTALSLKNFDMGNKNKIPALVEVIDLLVLFNKIRYFNEKNPIILNIEFKDKTSNSVTETLKIVGSAIEEGEITQNSVVYCSFDHDSLFQAIKIDSTVQVALALKTAFLFGADNVDVQAGWTVGLNTKYQQNAISYLETKISEAKEIKGRITALDAVLWDIEPALVTLASNNSLDLHVSTSDFRNFDDVVFLGNLVEMCQSVKVFFKTDEPGKINRILQRAYVENTIDLSESKVTKFSKISESKISEEQSSNLDLTSVTIKPDIPFLRQPKPKQECSTTYQKDSIDKLSVKLAKYIEERNKDSATIAFVTEQRQEELIDSDVIDHSIFTILNRGELISYFDIEY
jgi:glycerophosphoryl diester phosphodiesterase